MEPQFEYKEFYRRKLPHLHAPGSTLFVTFRLAGSIPKKVVTRWKIEKHSLEKEIDRLAKLDDSIEAHRKQKDRWAEFYRGWFKRFEDILHREDTGPIWLKTPEIADVVVESLHHRDGKEYKLRSFCVMSNHVHVVFTPFLDSRSLTEIANSNPLRFVSEDPTLGRIMKSLKGYTARKANLALGRAGSFWDTESYDHMVRDGGEFVRIQKYVLNNPVKAGLVRDWRHWRWSWAETRPE
jgi:REP element-mobilizing transposase RayT